MIMGLKLLQQLDYLEQILHLANTWAVETITVTHPGGDGNVVYTIESGKTHPEAVATALRVRL